MKSFNFDRKAYLRRINYAGDTTATWETLKALHHAQLYNIPLKISTFNWGAVSIFRRTQSLKSNFGIELDAPYEKLRPLPKSG